MFRRIGLLIYLSKASDCSLVRFPAGTYSYFMSQIPSRNETTWNLEQAHSASEFTIVWHNIARVYSCTRNLMKELECDFKGKLESVSEPKKTTATDGEKRRCIRVCSKLKRGWVVTMNAKRPSLSENARRHLHSQRGSSQPNLLAVQRKPRVIASHSRPRPLSNITRHCVTNYSCQLTLYSLQACW